jgi:hypothetical protein
MLNFPTADRNNDRLVLQCFSYSKILRAFIDNYLNVSTVEHSCRRSEAGNVDIVAPSLIADFASVSEANKMLSCASTAALITVLRTNMLS